MLSVVLLSLVAAAVGRPQLPADVSEAQCPNFPYCAPTAVDLSAFTPAQQVIGLDQRDFYYSSFLLKYLFDSSRSTLV